MTPDWQLPPGVDRGLWDYLHSREMVDGYDAQMAASPLAATDIDFCEKHFPQPGRLVDLGCGTGRLAHHFSRRGCECVGVDLSEAMLARAKQTPSNITWLQANLVDVDLPTASFDYAASLFSTLGMVRDPALRRAVVANAYRILKPGGRFVVHVHHRWFHRLGWRKVLSGDLRMPQAYGGAPLTIHHFTQREILSLLTGVGFTIREVLPLMLNEKPATMPWRVYGFLIAVDKP